MAFSRLAAKARAAPVVAQDPEAAAWQARMAQEQEERSRSEATASQAAAQRIEERKGGAVEEAKQRAVAEDAKWKVTQQTYNANLAEVADRRQRQQLDEEKARQLRIERSKAEAAKRAQGSGGIGGGGLGSRGSRSEFAWKKTTPLAPAGGYKAHSAPAADLGDLPTHDDCELAVSAIISRTMQGMKEGLRGLGLPDYPMTFSPGKELQICGHDVREVVNEMIHAWMTDEKDDFYNVLLRVRSIVANPILTEEEMGMMEQHASYEAVWGRPGGTGLADRAAKSKPVTSTVGDDDSDDEVIDVSSNTPARQEPPSSAGRSFAKAGLSTAPPPAAAPAPVVPAPAGDLEDHYGLLGVAQTATLQEIRMKFRKLVVTEHPEKGGDPKKFAKLNKAYGVLIDQERRRQYNEQLAAAGGGELVD